MDNNREKAKQVIKFTVISEILQKSIRGDREYDKITQKKINRLIDLVEHWVEEVSNK